MIVGGLSRNTLASSQLSKIFIETGIDEDDRILCLNKSLVSEMLNLCRSGYTNLYIALDSNKIYSFPMYTRIRYVYADPMDTHFPPSFFKSVIIQSTDSPLSLQNAMTHAFEILDDNGLLLLKMNNISTKEIQFLKEKLASWTQSEAQIHGDFICLRKARTCVPSRQAPTLTVLCYSQRTGGISEYAGLLTKRLEKEYFYKVQIKSDPNEVSSDVAIIEYESGLKLAPHLIDDIQILRQRGCEVIIEVHDWLTRSKVLSYGDVLQIQEKSILLYRANELAELDKAKKYYLCPHISYDINFPSYDHSSEEIVLGSFGFGSYSKRFEKIVSLAERLNVKAKLMISKNDEYVDGEKVFYDVLERLASNKNVVFVNEDYKDSMNGKKVFIKTGFFSQKEIVDYLAECTHIIFAHKSRPWSSGVMTFAKRLHKPIVALDSFQARQAQVTRVNSFSRKEEFITGILGMAKSILALDTRLLLQYMRNVINSMLYPSLTKKSLIELRNELTRDEDGLPYLVKVIRSKTGSA